MLTRKYIHSNMADGKWNKLSIYMQLGNIGGEIQRYINAKVKGQEELAMKAFDRALELIDLSKIDPKNKTKPRLKELSFFREILCDTVLFKSREFNNSIEDLNQYCMQYAIAARYHL